MAGPAPTTALHWIKQTASAPVERPTKTEVRQDHYLCLPDIGSVGIKLREGKFEVKRRDIDLGLCDLGSRASGRLALWRKWSFRMADELNSPAPEHWIKVEKERYLRKYSVEDDILTAVDPGSYPSRGCTVEMTCLQVHDAKWWSVGFEAFGPVEGQLCETLKLVAKSCFSLDGHPTLEGANSFDYPEWLASL